MRKQLSAGLLIGLILLGSGSGVLAKPAAPAPATVPPEPSVKKAQSSLKDGTPVILKTLDEMVSGRTPKGSTVNFRVERDVIATDGRVLIPAGAVATGKVTVSEGHGIFGKEGKLDITLDSAVASDGTIVPLRAVRTATGENAHDLVIGGALLVSVFFVLFSGHNVEIPAGTLMNAFVNGEIAIARPAPARISPAELKLKRSVALVIPGLPEPVQKEDRLIFSGTLNPPDENAYLRLYVDDKMVGWQKGNLGKIEWVAEHLKEGEHQAHLEATYSNGLMVDSGPTKFQLKD